MYKTTIFELFDIFNFPVLHVMFVFYFYSDRIQLTFDNSNSLCSVHILHDISKYHLNCFVHPPTTLNETVINEC